MFTKFAAVDDVHDFGAFDHAGERYMFKIDYYDRDLEHAAEDPADASKTTRVLTIMRADDDQLRPSNSAAISLAAPASFQPGLFHCPATMATTLMSAPERTG